MKFRLTFAAVLAATTTAQAASFHQGALEAARPWSRPTVAGATAVGYMALSNHGTAPDALVGATSPLAASVEIHATSIANGVMSMQQQKRVALPPKGGAAFAPGAYHLMFMGITRTLKAGDILPATLTFASGAKLKVAFAVSVGAPEPAASMPGMNMSR